MDVRVKQGLIESEPADAVVLTHFQGENTLLDEGVKIDRLLGGAIRDLLKSGEFAGKPNQTVVLHSQGKLPSKRVLLLGLGRRTDAKLDSVRQAMGTAVKRIRQAGARSFVTPLHGRSIPDVSTLELAQAMTEGALLGTYQFTAYRTNSNGDDAGRVDRMTVIEPAAGAQADVKEGVRRGLAAAEAASFVRDLCNHPSNVMTPSRIAAEARQISKERSVRLKILERRDAEKLGMGAFLGVARGSHEPPKFIVLEYSGAPSRRNGRQRGPIVLVGKTITFDTGGISLKPAENMEQMKADMTGGAEVLAAVRAASRLRLPLHVIGILPATENMPGGRAIKPGDILKTLSGLTVEVQNTDAEGRLILADGLNYATRLKPSAIVDIATLTGACVVALGQFAIGMFGNNEPLKSRIQRSGLKAGERVWEMPLWEDYFEQLKSDVADMRNIGGRGGGMITAALFLSKFVGDCPWVHLDIASTDWSERERAYIPKGPTGIGTRLLIQFLIDTAMERGREP